MTGFIFGGDTGVESAAELARKREIVNALMDPGMGMPQTFGEGLTVFGRALAGRIKDKKLGVKEDAERARVSSAFDAITGQLMPQQGAMPRAPAAPVDPNSPSAIGADTMSALGKGPGGVDFSAIEAQYGLPSGYLSQTAQIESGMDPNAKNPNSSAEGLFQFIDATASNYGLKDKRDPAAATDAAARLARDNAAQLRNVLGREPTAGELYLAHQQGGAGASRLLSNPDALASAIVGADAVRLNGGSENMTAGEFANKWISRLSGQMPQSANPDIVSQLSELASNQYATDAQKAIVQQLMGQQIDAMKPQAAPDPMDAIKLEKAALELEQMKNPQADPMADIELQTAQLKLDQLQSGQPAGATEYGTTPVLGRNAAGDVVLMQIGKDGTAVETKLPEGVKADLGLAPMVKAEGSAIGKAAGEADVAADSLSSKMAGVESVVSELDTLADQATYTNAGQLLDYGRKQLGMDPRESAVARAEYIAKVDSQVLPLLRDTFGAAFTVEEGKTLRATLGDPDKSPEEKKAVLRAFIEQKKRDLLALQQQAGNGALAPPTAPPTAPPAAPPAAATAGNVMRFDAEGNVIP